MVAAISSVQAHVNERCGETASFLSNVEAFDRPGVPLCYAVPAVAIVVDRTPIPSAAAKAIRGHYLVD